MGKHLDEFRAGLGFDLDDFQVEGCEAVEDGLAVLVAAPTGAGKTVVGEFAVFAALAEGRKAFYTTPIKALSNQKYHDLVARYGVANVGLLTGDSSINADAPVVVMTTEVLRNMMYNGSSSLDGLGYVVMDEVHYLADRFRGPVWEEVIILLPQSVQVVSLSATVSNAEEFGAWLGQVRGHNRVVVSEHRPVPLWQHVLVGRELYDLFADSGTSIISKARDTRERITNEIASLDPELLDRLRELERGGFAAGGRGGRAARSGSRHNDPWGSRGRGRRHGSGGAGGPGGDAGPDAGPRDARLGSRPGGGASRAEVVAGLERDGLLPAITFIFSRNGCDAAVTQLLAAGTRLVPPKEGETIRRIATERLAGVADEDLGVLGYHDFVEGLTRGFAAHHAGMLPTFRELVEELFTAGRIKAVFATETLALGINMPARTVVLEKLVKFNGESHVGLTPAEYTQLTGRAGRRGIDIEGHAVVQWSRGMDVLAVAGLASTRTYPLNSSFRPTYNMAVNLVERVGRADARDILETSFAQFQADRGVVGIATQIRRNEDALAGYAESMTCERGDFRAYATLRERIRSLEKDIAKDRGAARRAAVERSLEALEPGDVITIGSGRRAGRAIVIATNVAGKHRPSTPLVVDDDARARRVTVHDVDAPVEVLAHLPIGKGFNPKNAKARRDLAATVRAKVPHDPPRRSGGRGRDAVAATGRDGERLERSEAKIAQLRSDMRSHPCHACPDRENHARWAERYHRLERETQVLRRKVSVRTDSVARTFDQVCAVLAATGYLDVDGTSVTEQGAVLRRLYTEKDLLAAECLVHGVFEGLDAASLASVVSALIYEARRDDTDPTPRTPNAQVADAYRAMVEIWSRLDDLEVERKLPVTAAPDGGMLWAMHRWASGKPLEECLRDSDMAAGDFVRRAKQIVDLLGQIGQCAPQPGVRGAARRAVDAVMRGVVAADRLD